MKRPEIVIGRIPYIEIRGRWCDIIAANAHVPTEDKSEDMQAYLCEELQHILVQLGTAVAQFLRCCATSRKVAGSIPASVNGFFVDKKTLPIALWSWDRFNL